MVYNESDVENIVQVTPSFGCSVTAPCECCDPDLNCRQNVSEVWGSRVHLLEAGEILQSGCGYMRVSNCAPLPLMEQFAAFPSGLGSQDDLNATAMTQTVVAAAPVNSTGGTGSSSQLGSPVALANLASQESAEQVELAQAGDPATVASPTSSTQASTHEPVTVHESINSAQATPTPQQMAAESGFGDTIVIEPGSAASEEFTQPPFVASGISGLEPDSYYAGNLFRGHEYSFLSLL